MSRTFEEFQHPAIQTKILQHSGGYFHNIKVHQPIGRKDSIQNMISRRLDLFLYEVAQKYSKLLKYSKLKFKKIKNLYG